MANRRYIDFPIASTSGDTDIILIWQDGANKQTTKATFLSGLPENLDELNDVAISGLTNGQILRYDFVTGKWENTDQGNLDLNDLNDVTIVSPSNGQVLVYNSSTSKWENSSGGYVPYIGAVTTVDLGAQGLRAGYVRFDTTVSSVPDEQGLMYWDGSRSTVALIMNGTLQHIGQDSFFYVKNSTGSSINKGVAVRFDGTDGASGHLKIAPFLADGTYPSNYFMGVTADTIGNGEFGQVMHFGELEGINTSGFTAGDLLYASTIVAGGFQTTAPVAPNNIVLIGAAINSKNNGAIIVRPTYGSNINNDEGVKITTPTTGQLLQLQAGGLWENKTIAQVLGGTSSQFVKGDGSLDSTTYQNTADKGQPNGYASLDGNGKVPLVQINDALIGNVNFQGLWNASTNTPTLVDPPSSGTKGYYYIVSTGGTFAGITFEVGDWIISNGTAWGKVDNTDAVSSVFGRTGNVTASNGDYNTSQVTENTNLYYTEARVNANTNVAANTAARHNAVTLGTANGLSLSTQQLSLALASGSTTGALSSTDWTTFNNKENAITAGTTAQYFRGDKTFQTLNTAAVPELTNLYYTEARVNANTNVAANTAARHAAVTLGTANGLSLSTQQLSLGLASSGVTGALSGTDWTTFNGKQNALTNPVTGTGTTNYLPKFTGASTIGNSQVFDNGTNVGIGTASPPTDRILQMHNSTGTFARFGLTNTTTGSAGGDGLIFQMENNVAIIKNQENNDLRIGTNGSETQLVLKPSGNVGIGTPSPNNIFTIYAASSAIYTQWIQSGTGTTSTDGLRIGLDASSNGIIDLNEGTALITKVDGSEGMRIFAGGNTHIGPTPASDNGARLQVNGTATVSSSLTAATLTTIGTAVAGQNVQLNLNGVSGKAQRIEFQHSGVQQWLIGCGASSETNAFEIFNSTGANSLSINKSTNAATFSSSVTAQGVNVGSNALGTDRMFQISGTAFTSGATQFAAVINPTMGSLTTVYGLYLGTNVTSATNAYGLYLEANGGSVTNKFAIYQSGASDKNYFAGNIGIGTPSPAGKLEINGLTFVNNTGDSTARLLLRNSTTGANAGGLDIREIGVDASINNASNGFLSISTNNTERMRIFAGGNTHIGPTPASDNGARLQVSGTATISGSLTAATLSTIGTAVAATNVQLNLNGVSGKAQRIEFQHSGVQQWLIGCGASSETNAFEIFNSTGVNSLSINKSTNAATFSSTVATTGIKFPASQVASADANTLDDYEEGAWIPDVDAQTGTYTLVFGSRGTYTKIGRVVTVQYYFRVVDKGTGSGTCILSNLPFSSLTTSTDDSYTGTGIRQGNDLNTLVINQNSSSLNITENTGDPIVEGQWNAGSITYFT